MVKLESLKRWNEERGLWCEKGVQVLLTTVGAFAAFGLMTIAISTDYWLYTRALICNTTNLTAGDDGPQHRGGGGASEKKDPGGLTHSGLWRICCLEGRVREGLPAATAPALRWRPVGPPERPSRSLLRPTPPTLLPHPAQLSSSASARLPSPLCTLVPPSPGSPLAHLSFILSPPSLLPAPLPPPSLSRARWGLNPPLFPPALSLTLLL